MAIKLKTSGVEALLFAALLGTVFGWAYAQTFHPNMEIYFTAYLSALGIALVSGLVFGLLGTLLTLYVILGSSSDHFETVVGFACVAFIILVFAGINVYWTATYWPDAYSVVASAAGFLTAIAAVASLFVC